MAASASRDTSQTLGRGLNVLELVAASPEGLTPAQHQLLLAVRGHAGADAPSPSDLAEALHLRLHSVVELLSRAEANGLIVRHADSHYRLRLTASNKLIMTK